MKYKENQMPTSWFAIVLSMLLLFAQVACSSRRPVPALERKVTMPIYQSERLESAMIRLALNTRRSFDVQVLTIDPQRNHGQNGGLQRSACRGGTGRTVKEYAVYL